MSANSILTSLNSNGSGLDIVQLARDLSAADITPRKAILTRQVDAANLSISAFETLSLEIGEMRDTLRFAAGLETLSLTSDQAAVLPRITQKSVLPQAGVEVEVIQTAQTQVLEFSGFNSPTAPLGDGAITVERGTWDRSTPPSFAADPDRAPQRITLPKGATLQDLAAALSRLEGVSARVIDLGEGQFSLGVNSDLGAGNALNFRTDPTADPSLAQFDFSNDLARVERRGAMDAQLRVDGILAKRPTNEIDDLIPGMALTLTGKTTSPAQVTAAPQVDIALGIVQTYVDMFNALQGNLRNMTSGQAASDSPEDISGALSGNLALRQIQREFTSFLNSQITGYGAGDLSLAAFGVRTNRDGSLSLNEAELRATFQSDPMRFDALVKDRIQATDSAVEISGAPTANAQAGRYGFRVNPVDGSATLDGAATFGRDLPDGRRAYSVIEGPLRGLTLTMPQDVAKAEIDYGKSLSSRMADWVDQILAPNGTIGKSSEALREKISEHETMLGALEERGEMLRMRYLSRFTEMERVVTSLNSTGEYIQSLLDAWNADN